MADYTGALVGPNGSFWEIAQITENVMAILCNRGRFDSYKNFSCAVHLAYPAIEHDLKKYHKIYVDETTDVLKDFLKTANYVFTFFTHKDDTYIQLTADFNSMYGELVYAIIPVEQDLILKRDGTKYELKHGDAEFLYYHYARITLTILQMIKLLRDTIGHVGARTSVDDFYNKFVLEGEKLATAVLKFGGSDLDVLKFLGYFKDVFEVKTLDSVEINFTRYELLKIATEIDFIYSIVNLSATGNKLLSDVVSHVSDILKAAGIVAQFDLNSGNIKSILARRPDFLTAGVSVYAIHALIPAFVDLFPTQDDCDTVFYLMDSIFEGYLRESEFLQIGDCEKVFLKGLSSDFERYLQVDKFYLRDLVVARLYSQSKSFTFDGCSFRLRTAAVWDMTCIHVKQMPGKLPAMHLLFDQWSRTLKPGLRVGRVVFVRDDAAMIRADFNENDIFPNFSCFCHISFTHVNEARVSCLTECLMVNEIVIFKLGVARTDTPTLHFFCYVENILKEESTARGIKRKLDDSPDSKKKKPDKFARETAETSDGNDTSIDSEPSHSAAESTAESTAGNTCTPVQVVILSSDESDAKETEESSPDTSICAVATGSAENTSSVSELEAGPAQVAVARQLDVPERVVEVERQLDDVEPMVVNLPVESSASDESSMSSSTQGL